MMCEQCRMASSSSVPPKEYYSLAETARLLHVHVRKSGEVLRVERLDGERRRVARDDRRVVLGCHVHGCVGQVLHDLGEQLAGNHGLARLLDERRNRVLDGQLEVGRLKRKGVVVRVEEIGRASCRERVFRAV